MVCSHVILAQNVTQCCTIPVKVSFTGPCYLCYLFAIFQAVFDDAPLPRQDGLGQLNAEKKDSNVAVYHAGQKRPRSRSSSPPRSSSGDLKVTVNKKGRSVQDGPTQVGLSKSFLVKVLKYKFIHLVIFVTFAETL